MITNIELNPTKWKKDVYIAKKLRTDVDEEGNEITIYDIPIGPLKFNYQPISTSADIAEFGENAKIMQKMVIPISYKDQFKEFDVAYIEGATPNDEVSNGDNANYRLLPPRNGNAVINIYLEKITGK